MVFRKKDEKEAKKLAQEAKINLKRARNSQRLRKINDAKEEASRANRRLRRVRKDTQEKDQ